MKESPDLFSGLQNIKWQDGSLVPAIHEAHIAVLHDGMVYIGGGNYRIDIHNPANNSWSHSPVKIPIRWFAMTTLNNQVIIAAGKLRNKVTNKVFLLDSNQIKEYTKMIMPRYDAAAAGHQEMLIIAGGRDDQDKALVSTELFDSTTEQWYAVGHLPLPRWRLQPVIMDDILYVIGGRDQYCATSQAVFTTPL